MSDSIHIRISEYLKDDFSKVAQEEGLSISSAIRILISDYTKKKIEIGTRKDFYKTIYLGYKGERIV